MTDVMRSLSVTVRLTPRQAVAAMRALKMAAATEYEPRAYRVRERVMFGLWDAGWVFDEYGDECWRRGKAPHTPDRVPE